VIENLRPYFWDIVYGEVCCASAPGSIFHVDLIISKAIQKRRRARERPVLVMIHVECRTWRPTALRLHIPIMLVGAVALVRALGGDSGCFGSHVNVSL